MTDPPNSHHFTNPLSRDSRPVTSPSSTSTTPVYTAQPIPILAAGKTSNLSSQMAKIQDSSSVPPPSQGILYPVASSGRGFIPRTLRPQSSDQLVTVANPGGFPPRSVVAFANQVRPFGFPHSDPQAQQVHAMRPLQLQPTHLGSRQVGGTVSGSSKSIPVPLHSKVGPFSSSTSDLNGYKDLRDRSRDDTVVTINDRKVRLLDGASLYTLCRSWVQNGLHQESQPHFGEGVKPLPRPLPTTVSDTRMPKRNKGDDEDEEKEEDVGSVEHLSAQDLLHKHIKRAKKVRARLREERLQRIARYKQRLALLLPPPVEQFRNDTTNGS